MAQHGKRDLRSLLSEAQRALGAGRLSDGENLLARARTMAPKAPHGAYLLGLLRHQQRHHEEALGLLREAMPHFQNDPSSISGRR